MNGKAYAVGGVFLAVSLLALGACVGDDPTSGGTDNTDSGADATSDSPLSDGGTGDGSSNDAGASCSEVDASGAYKTFAAFNDSVGAVYGVSGVSTGHILVGGYAGTATFGGDAGITSTASGLDDAFVVSKNSDGSVAWAATFGGNNVDAFYSVATDASDNIYVAGVFSSTSFTVGTAFSNPSGVPLQIVAKLSPATGAVLWAESFSPSPAPASVNDHSGCVIATNGARISLGCTMGLSQNFSFADGGAAVLANNNELGASIYGLDPASGGVLWAHALETNDGADGGTITTIDSIDIAAENTVVSGTFTGDALQSSGASGVNMPRIGTLANGFVISFGANGGALSGKNFGDATSAGGVGAVYVAESAAGDQVLVGGSISGPTNLGGGVSTPQGSDGYVMSLSESSGTIGSTPQWTKIFGGPSADAIQRVRFDLCGDVEFMLTTNSTLTIDGINLPAPQSGQNAEIVGKLASTSSNATLLWANGVTPTGNGDTTQFQGLDFNVNAKNNTLLVGSFKGAINFGNGMTTSSRVGGFSAYEIIYYP